MRRFTIAAALAASLAGPAVAQEPLDLGRQVYLQARQPVCASASKLADVVILAVQGAFDMAAQVDGCIALRRPVQAFIMESAGEDPLRAYRVRVRLPQTGVVTDVWAMVFSLTNRRP